MAIDLNQNDGDLAGYSEQAKRQLAEEVRNYKSDLVDEASRIEAARGATDGHPEVTAGMVEEAAILLRRGLGPPKPRWGQKVLRVISAVLSLGVGIMYDGDNLQNSLYMLGFIILVAAAILSVTIATLKE